MPRRKKKTQTTAKECKKLQINTLDGIILNLLHCAYSPNNFYSLEKALKEKGKVYISMPAESFSNYDYVSIEIKLEKK